MNVYIFLIFISLFNISYGMVDSTKVENNEPTIDKIDLLNDKNDTLRNVTSTKKNIENTTNETIPCWLIKYKTEINTIKDIINIVFFVIIALCTLFGYLKARNTILEPLKSEAVKNSIDNSKAIYAMFINKSENELRNEIDLIELMVINELKIIEMYDKFVLQSRVQNDLKIGDLQEKKTGIPQNVLSELIVIEYEIKHNRKHQSKNNLTREKKLKIWNDYFHDYISISLPQKYSDYENELIKLISSPFLFQEIKEKLKEYLDLMNNNIDIMSKSLKRFADELPSNEKIIHSPFGFYNMGDWQSELLSYENKAKQIIYFIENYYQSKIKLKRFALKFSQPKRQNKQKY